MRVTKGIGVIVCTIVEAGAGGQENPGGKKILTAGGTEDTKDTEETLDKFVEGRIIQPPDDSKI